MKETSITEEIHQEVERRDLLLRVEEGLLYQTTRI